ncbi:hypothetical protein [Actinomadura sp. CNU-125]|uniref:hypothetical protein n=1 Tax=Actinomadura sp. CNU-125 TaxID=1904961 RepID=UPI0021CCE8B3|nr:hypothetical protein [Actinomadura sp. CNU-125]
MSIGMGLCVPPLSVRVMASLPPARAGLGSGLNSAAREIGSALGVAVLGTVLTGRLAGGPPSGTGGPAHSVGEALGAAGGDTAARARVIEVFTGGLSAGYRVVAVVVCVLAVAAALSLPWRGE